MTWSFKSEISGDKKAMRKLRTVNVALQRRILRKAVNKATGPLMKSAKQKCPTQSKLLRKSLGRKVKVMRRTGVVVGIIGPRTGFKQEVTFKDKRTGKKVTELRNPTRYAHLVENRKPFLRPTFDSGKAQAQTTITAEIHAGVEAAAKT